MRDQTVLVNPLFSASGGATGGANRGAVDTPQLLVDLSGVEVVRLQAGEDFVERPVRVPLVKQVPYGCPRTKFLGQITPWGAGSKDPKDAIDNRPPIARRATRAGRLRKHVLDTLPLVVGKSMPSHFDALHGQLETSDHSLHQIPLAMEHQFSDKA